MRIGLEDVLIVGWRRSGLVKLFVEVADFCEQKVKVILYGHLCLSAFIFSI